MPDNILKHYVPLYLVEFFWSRSINIKTHGSESQGQENTKQARKN